ncbi:MAG TPA: metallophosphoesterase family protein [bacterium]|nr:metallophosphoesterase family protein [bacterium]
MKVIIFSDIHANIDAFKAFLALAETIDHERMYNLGDTVGYGAGPNECIDLVRYLNISSVAGNHDDVVLGRYEPAKFNPDGRRAIQWCRGELRDENADWLRTLGDFFWIDSVQGKALLVHGSPVDKDEYIMSKWNAERAFTAMMERDIAISFVGHTHKACLWLQEIDGSPSFKPQSECEGSISLDPSLKVIVNVGSIGQPRDRDPRGGFVIWDDEQHTIRFIRFDYPIEAAQKRITDAGLPRFLADRLAGGY